VSLDKSKISDLIEKNYVFASVLYHFGIEFYDYAEETLEQVCNQRGLHMQHVIDSLEQAVQLPEVPNLNELPVDIVIAYLRHSHYLFIKRRLPYIARLVNEIKDSDALNAPAIEDLKTVFPLYVEDFVRHVFHEEDSLFVFIQQLLLAYNGEPYNYGRLYYMMEDNSVEELAIEHDCHDDEMTGIRTLTGNYSLPPNCSLLVKVVYQELQNFEQELIAHARIENEILFPKALVLEKGVKKKLRKLTSLN
jgi:regulator of cell morphogenesis and NO signaling